MTLLDIMARNYKLRREDESTKQMAWDILKKDLPQAIKQNATYLMITGYPTPIQFKELDAHFYAIKAKRDEDTVHHVAAVSTPPAPPPFQNQPRPNFNYTPRPNYNNAPRSQSNFRNNYTFRPPLGVNNFRQPGFRPFRPMNQAPRFLYNNDKYCWYHKRFGVQAVKCREPCLFIKEPPNDVKLPIDTSKIMFLKE